MAEEVDIISTLPDAVLCYILSFLETKQADATTILSKRWKHLWRSVPTMRFITQVTDQNSNLDSIDFIYSVLLSRDPTLPIQTFHLNVTYDHPLHCHTKSITKWFNFVLQRGVEYLYLYVSSANSPQLPITILTCRTLVVLKLFYFKVVLEGFSSVLLPSLKTLHLKYVCFPELGDFMLFLTGCPNLENLLTFDVSFDSEESLTSEEWKNVCLSNLTRADIDCARNYFPLKAVHNVTSIRLEIGQEHYLHDLMPTFHNLTQLELISLDYSWEFLVIALNHCPKLQKLDIDQADVDKETWSRDDDKENWVDPDVVPRCLSLHLRTCNLFNFLGLQGELKLARYILKNASVLQAMKIWNAGQPETRRILSSFPKASSACKLMVYHDQCEDRSRKSDQNVSTQGSFMKKKRRKSLHCNF